MKLDTVPWARALSNIKSGDSDLIPMLTKNIDRIEYMIFTDPIYVDPVYLYYNSEVLEDFQWEEWKDLEPYNIGIVRGYQFSKEWDEAVQKYNYKIDKVRNDELNINKLIKKRIEITPLFFSVAQNLLSEIKGSENIKRAEKPLTKLTLYYGVSKKSVLANQIDQINITIREMKADGTYRKILGEYFVEF